MFRQQDVLFPTDFSPYAEFAMDYAIAMARQFGGRLHIAHVLDSTWFSQANVRFSATKMEMDTMYASMREHAEARMEHVAQIAADSGVTAEVHVEKGAPWEKTVALAEALHVGLIVIPTHGRSGFDRLVYGSCCERVVRHAPAPVLCIKHPEHEFVEEMDLKVHLERVLFPTDFSDFSLQMMPYAETLCRLFGAHLTLLHVVEPPVLLPEVMPQAPLTLEAEQVEQAMERLNGLASDLKGVAALCEVRSGIPHRLIGEVAREQGTDLVVIPTHGRSGLTHLLFGSVAEKVVRSAGCPVMTVRPGKEAARVAEGKELKAAQSAT